MSKENPQSAFKKLGRNPQSIATGIALLLLPLIYFFPAVMGKVTLAPGDGWTQILGIRILIGQMLAQGELPLWNPYIFAGMPLLASIQPGALYPPTWLFALLSPQVAMNVLVLTTYHLALFGTYLFARRIGCTRVGALIAAMTFSFGGYMVAHLGHTNRINAAAWLPWILLAVEMLHRQLRWRWVTAGALFIALQVFAGDPQMTLYTAMTVGAYAVFRFVRTEPPSRATFAVGLVVMVVGSALLAMIQLLPARELLKLGDRAGIDYQYFAQFSFPPSQVFELFFPYFFGGAATAPYSVPYWGRWNLTETCGYVGMTAWLLAFAAVFARKRLSPTKSHEDGTKSGTNGSGFLRDSSCDFVGKDLPRSIKFWAIFAVVALLLSFGSFLPFGINKLLHQVPVFNLFRAAGRNLMEFDFALAMLAGLGATVLTQLDRALVRRVLLKSAGLVAAIAIAGAVVYRFFSERLKAEVPIPTNAGAWSNPELYVPLVFLLLSVAAVMLYARRWSALSGAVLIAVLFLDLFAFGFFYEWRLIDDNAFNVAARIADPPTVKFIKAREADWNSFRIVSQSVNPFGANADLLNYPNFAIARGLQSINGYDPARLGQMAEIAGRVTLDGVITEPISLAANAQGFNLLNAKYLLKERPAPAAKTISHEGIAFNDRQFDLRLKRNAQVQVDAKATADELAIISALENIRSIPDGTPVANIKLRTAGGQVIERQMLAGRDTSLWTANSAATIASFNKIGFRGQGYLVRLKFDRAEIESLEFNCLLGEGDLIITRASLFDSATSASHFLNEVSLSPERWRKLADFGEVELYENLKVRPRAWLATKAVLAPSVEVMRSIETGRMADGSPIDLTDTVLLEAELFANRQLKTPLASSAVTSSPNSQVRITRYEPRRIELQSNSSQPGFLVLSEIYYRGWEAWVDGQRTSVERVNFTLRGVELSPGDHKIEFVFRAPSFRTGAAWSLAGVLLLLVGGFVFHRKRK